MIRKLAKGGSVELVDVEGTSEQGISDADFDAAMNNTELDKRNPITRSQQYKENPNAIGGKIGEANPGIDPDYIPSESEHEDGEAEDEHDDEEEEDQEDDEDEEMDEESEENNQSESAPDDDEDDVKIIAIEKQMPGGRKPSFVKNLSGALDAVGKTMKMTAKGRGLEHKKEIGADLKAQPKKGTPMIKAVPRKSDFKVTGYGLEGNQQKKLNVATASKPSQNAPRTTVGKVLKKNLLVDGNSTKSTTKPPHDFATSGSRTNMVPKRKISKEALEGPSTKKQKMSDEEMPKNLIMDDFAPTNGCRQLQLMDIHIGESVRVKLEPFKGRDYIMVRHFLPDGTLNPRRGINLDTKFLPGLKRAIDVAYKCFMELK